MWIFRETFQKLTCAQTLVPFISEHKRPIIRCRSTFCSPKTACVRKSGLETVTMVDMDARSIPAQQEPGLSSGTNALQLTSESAE